MTVVRTSIIFLIFMMFACNQEEPAELAPSGQNTFEGITNNTEPPPRRDLDEKKDFSTTNLDTRHQKDEEGEEPNKLKKDDSELTSGENVVATSSENREPEPDLNCDDLEDDRGKKGNYLLYNNRCILKLEYNCIVLKKDVWFEGECIVKPRSAELCERAEKIWSYAENRCMSLDEANCTDKWYNGQCVTLSKFECLIKDKTLIDGVCLSEAEMTTAQKKKQCEDSGGAYSTSDSECKCDNVNPDSTYISHKGECFEYALNWVGSEIETTPNTDGRKLFTFMCGSNSVIVGEASEYDFDKKNRKDRKFTYKCRSFKNVKRECSWTSYSSYKQDVESSCPANKVLAGVKSEHDDNQGQDRKFKYYCCKLKLDFEGDYYLEPDLESCKEDNEANEYHKEVQSVADTDMAMVEVKSTYDSDKDDRQFSFKYCGLKLKEKTSEESN